MAGQNCTGSINAYGFTLASMVRSKHPTNVVHFNDPSICAFTVSLPLLVLVFMFQVYVSIDTLDTGKMY